MRHTIVSSKLIHISIFTAAKNKTPRYNAVTKAFLQLLLELLIPTITLAQNTHSQTQITLNSRPTQSRTKRAFVFVLICTESK